MVPICLKLSLVLFLDFQHKGFSGRVAGPGEVSVVVLVALVVAL